MKAYSIDFTPDDNNTFLATCPALPEVTTFGDTKAQAIEFASDAIVEALASRMKRNEDIPNFEETADTDLAAIPSRVAMKTLLYKAMKRQGITKYRLMKIMDASQVQIDRLLNVQHNTNFDMLDNAMAALDGSFVIAERQELHHHAI